MKTLLLVVLVPSIALAQDRAGTAGTSGAPSSDRMAGWVPPKVKSEAKDKQEIQGVLRSVETAARTGDLDAAAALVDFPVTMMTDDSKGQAKGETWDREKWTQVMKPFYDRPMKEAKVTHKSTIFLLSDSLATVTDVYTLSQGGKSITGRTSLSLLRREGKWRVKTMTEGGWGDVVSSQGSASTGGAGESTTSGSTGAGSSGGVAEPPGSHEGEHDVQAPKGPAPAERTTK